MDHAYTDMTSALTENRDWDVGEGLRNLIDTDPTEIREHIDSTVNNLVCLYPGCKSSGKIFKRSYELERHKLIHFPTRKLVCPVHECKQKKKGKFHTRNDKFREHVASHGELTVFCCPIPNCKSVQVKSVDFETHVANNHDIWERVTVKTLLSALKIEFKIGFKSCPVTQCSFGTLGTEYAALRDHIQTHDLSERVICRTVLESVSSWYLSFGKVTCPICEIQVCAGWDDIWKFHVHLEHSHAVDDLIKNGHKIAELVGGLGIINGSKLPNLFKVVRDFTVAKAVSPIETSAACEIPQARGNPSKLFSTEHDDYLWTFRGNIDDGPKVTISTGSGGLILQPLWSPQLALDHEIIMRNHGNLSPEGPMTQQLPMHYQTLVIPQSFMPSQNLAQPQSFIQNHDVLPTQAFIQPHVSVPEQTYVTPTVTQNPSMEPAFIQPVIPQSINLWQPIQNWQPVWAHNPVNPYEQVGWMHQPNIGYVNVTRPQDMASFVPIPENVSFGEEMLPDMQFGKPGNDSVN